MIGHKALVCRKRDRATEKHSSNRKPRQSNNQVASALDDRGGIDNVDDGGGVGMRAFLEYLGTDKQQSLPPPIRVGVLLNEREVTLDLDTGSPITVITERVWRTQLSSPRLTTTDLVVNCCGGHTLKVLGYFEGEVQFKERSEMLDVYVTSGTESCLFGRDTLNQFGMEFSIGKELGSHVGALQIEQGTLFNQVQAPAAGVKAAVGFDHSQGASTAIRPRIARNTTRLQRNGVAKVPPASALSEKMSTSERQRVNGQERNSRQVYVAIGAPAQPTRKSAANRPTACPTVSTRRATAKSHAMPRPGGAKTPSGSCKQIKQQPLTESESSDVVSQGGVVYRLNRVTKTLQHYMDCDYRLDIPR